MRVANGEAGSAESSGFLTAEKFDASFDDDFNVLQHLVASCTSTLPLAVVDLWTKPTAGILQR